MVDGFFVLCYYKILKSDIFIANFIPYFFLKCPSRTNSSRVKIMNYEL